jgi:hypothetical protein
MKKRLSLVVMLSLLVFSAAAQATYQVGDLVTDNFTLQDVYGETHSLFDYQGQCVLLNWFYTT